MFPYLRLLNTNFSSSECEEPIFEMFEKCEENLKLRTKVTQLHAVDLDKEKNITYKIAQNTDLNKSLSINKNTGEIFVNGLIDHEMTKWINLTILAYDNNMNTKTKRSLVKFHCRVVDTNDNAPKFVKMNTTEFEIAENNEKNLKIVQLKATDEDANEFGHVMYKIMSGDKDKFEIDAVTVSFHFL